MLKLEYNLIAKEFYLMYKQILETNLILLEHKINEQIPEKFKVKILSGKYPTIITDECYAYTLFVKLFINGEEAIVKFIGNGLSWEDCIEVIVDYIYTLWE